MAERTPATSSDNEVRLPSSSSPRAPSSASKPATPFTATSPATASAPSATSSHRITRSAARQAASQGALVTNNGASASAAEQTNSTLNVPAPATPTPSSTRKRKSISSAGNSSSATAQNSGSSGRRSKRQKTFDAAPQAATQTASTRSRSKKGKAPAVMDPSENLPDRTNHLENAPHTASSSRKSSRSKRSSQNGGQELVSAGDSGSARRTRKSNDGNDNDNDNDGNDTLMTGTDENRGLGPPAPVIPPESDDNEEEHDGEDDDDADDADRFDEDDPFGGFGGPGGMANLSGTLRALTGMMSGLSGRLRELLYNLKQDDPSVQLIALQELSEILLVSNEDNLSGHFSPDSFIKELVALMNKEESPEIMLLACRCLANLMEALPASTANVVYGHAVPVLCQKLLEISFIDLAEQALSTLEKISYEYPASIVREGGLTACLSFLDFFATGTQRTAVTIAANCCRSVERESFSVVRDVMPILLNVLGSSDQRVVEQASLCVSGIIGSFKTEQTKLEELVSVDLLRAILRLLVPGTTNLIGSNIHTQFLRVLAITARASPRLSAELFKLNVVETIYQILTGVSPPSGTDDVASKLDSVVIMQALIHRPREQIIETLNVICQLLPSLPKTTDPVVIDFVETQISIASYHSSSERSRRHDSNEKRVSLLEDCKDQVRRFALIIFPTLTDAFSSTVNLGVRQKVLIAQLKMLSNLDEDILSEALIPVPYASFLASILSQQDHPSLVLLGLQATELLVSRIDHIYRYQFYREGVMSEITALASGEDTPDPSQDADAHSLGLSQSSAPQDGHGHESDREDREKDSSSDDNDEEHDEDHEDDGEDDDENEENEPEPHPDDVSPMSSQGSTMSLDAPVHSVVDNRTMQRRIRHNAKKFLEVHETEELGLEMKSKAKIILDNLSNLSSEIRSFYQKRTALVEPEHGNELFVKLASYFDADVLESITSAEMLASGLVEGMLEVLNNPDEEVKRAAQATFLEVFMGRTVRSKPKTATADSPATPFSVMVHKLQDLLSRSEHFEVLTVHQNSFSGSRTSPASMLGKQIRLRLVADEDSDIPSSYRSIMVSIHAIATFKSLDEYLRPRMSLSERPSRLSRRDGLTRALAAMAGTAGFSLSSAAAARLADRSSFGALGGIPPPPPPPGVAAGSGSRSSRKSKTKSSDGPSTPEASAGPSSRGVLRRSSRHQAVSTETSPPARPPPTEDDQPNSTLECADEKQLTDDEDPEGNAALNAIMGDFDEEMQEDEEPAGDPSAVNMEVANSGGVTARKEDGERVPTPAGSGLGSRPATQSGSPAPGSSSRGMSYASALQTAPQDWHIEFSLDGKAISHDTTVYRAVHTSTKDSNEHINRSIWSSTYPIKYRRVPGPPPSESLSPTSANTGEGDGENSMPASLAKNPTTTLILQLLRILHGLNTNIEDVLVEKRRSIIGLHVEPLSQFVNTKLTAKLNRQLEEPLIVASACLPSWSEDLARLYPFLFPFETRHLFLQSTSFGYARSMARWQNAQVEDTRRDRHHERPFLGRLQRQKVRLSRSRILESAIKVMELYGSSQSILEVEYFEEVGTGLGPTLEFYSTVSKEFSKKKLNLWRETDSPSSSEFVSTQTGIFPRPISDDASAANRERVLQLFKVLGKFIARSMIDSRIIDININPIFFRIGDESGSGVKPSLGAVKVVDPALARSLMAIKNFSLAKKIIDEDPNRTAAQKVADTEAIVIDDVKLDDLCLDFTLPGYGINLIPNGSQQRVTIENVDFYLEKVIDATLGSGVRRQVDAFRDGFSQVFPYTALSAFTPEELVNLFGKAEEDWTIETLLDSIKADHGYNMDSPSVRNLLSIMSSFDAAERRDFLQFTTGSPKLPIGGFKSLTPMFTVVCKRGEEPYTADDYLPSVMTCVNYLKLPDYTTRDIMKKQMSVAMREGQGAFHLS